MNENTAARGGQLDDQNSCVTRMNAQSDAATCVLPEAMNNPLPKLAKTETVALWHAVNWMDLCLRGTKPEDVDTATWEAERERLRVAKQALRKVNRIRKEQQ